MPLVRQSTALSPRRHRWQVLLRRAPHRILECVPDPRRAGRHQRRGQCLRSESRSCGVHASVERGNASARIRDRSSRYCRSSGAGALHRGSPAGFGQEVGLRGLPTPARRAGRHSRDPHGARPSWPKTNSLANSCGRKRTLLLAACRPCSWSFQTTPRARRGLRAES
jgi:hypothetical protein